MGLTETEDRPRALVLFERSGVVRRALAAAGIDAWSVDLQPAADGSAQHLQCDVRDVLALLYDPNEQRYCWRTGRHDARPWGLVVAHPPCTYLCGSAAWAFGDGPYHQRVKPGTLVGAARRAAREASLQLVRDVLEAPVDRICVENPVGAIGTRIRPADQYVQPYDFGDDASKKTGLWLKGLPKLQPTHRIPPRMVAGRPRWANQTDSGQNRLSPSDDRADLRAETYPGIAAAMAAQWGPLLQGAD